MSHRIHLTNPRLLEEPAFRPPVFHTQQLSKPFISHAQRIFKYQYNIPLILITLGKDGSRAYYKDMKVEAAPFLQEKTIETTGAGDTFCASSLNYVLEHGLDNLTEENLKELLTFANAAASLITTRKGALRVMSTKEEVLDFMKSRGVN